MRVLQALTDRFRARRHGALSTYWAALAKIAGEPNASDRALDAVERSSAAIDKTPADVEADVALVAEFAELAGAPGDLESARGAHKASLADGAKIGERAAQMEREARILREGASRSVEVASGRVVIAERRAQQFAAVRARLAAAGHPEAASAENALALAVRVESAEGALRDAERELASSMGGSREHQALRQHNDAAERLRRLRAGEPEAGDGDDIDDAIGDGVEVLT